jgi:hypothetical protein
MEVLMPMIIHNKEISLKTLMKINQNQLMLPPLEQEITKVMMKQTKLEELECQMILEIQNSIKYLQFSFINCQNS